MRLNSHQSSAKYQSRNAPKVELPRLKIGDMIYIKSDMSKSKARDPYLVLNFVPNKNEVNVQKINENRNKRNVIRVHIQNIFKVKPDVDIDEVEEKVKPDCVENKETLTPVTAIKTNANPCSHQQNLSKLSSCFK